MQNTIESEAAWIRTATRDFRGRITVYEKATGKPKQTLPVDALEGFRAGLFTQTEHDAVEQARVKSDAEARTAEDARRRQEAEHAIQMKAAIEPQPAQPAAPQTVQERIQAGAKRP